MNNKWQKKFKQSGKKAWDATKKFFESLAHKTVEESRVVGLRASEAGKLTSLNTQRYKIQREINDHYHDLGERLFLISKDRNKDINDDSLIKSEFKDIETREKQLKEIDSIIEELRKETNKMVTKVHREYTQPTEIKTKHK